MTAAKRTAVLVSGRGSNMSALIEACKQDAFPAQISLVLSNRPDAAGLASAASQGIATAALDHKAYPSRETFDSEMDRTLHQHDIELVACAGFMRIFTSGFVSRWEGRMINIHPSLLPAYRGLDTHARALADGVKIHGCTVHFVSAELDAGAIIAQAAVPVLGSDTPDGLATRVLKQEHRIYPMALEMLASGRVTLKNGKASGQGVEDGTLSLRSPSAAR